MTLHFRKPEPDDPFQAAVVEESNRLARWDRALKTTYSPPLEKYLRVRRATVFPTHRHKGRLRKTTLARVAGHHQSPALLVGARFLAFGVMAILVAVSTFVAWVQFGEDPFVAEALKALRCSEARMLLLEDQGPRILPIDASESCIGTRSHLSVRIDDPKAVMRKADLIAGLEGKYRVGETIYGLDLRGVARLIAGRVGVVALLNALGIEATEGGSAPITSAFESALGLPNSLSDQPFKKIRLIAASMQFTRVHLDTDAKRAAFLVNHMPVIRGLGLDPVAGAYAENLLFTGKEPGLVRDCIYAAAAGFPIVAAKRGLALKKSWSRVKGRAGSCIRQNAQGEEELSASLAALEAFGFPSPRRTGPVSLSILNPLFGFQKSVSPRLAGSTLVLTLDAAMQPVLEREVADVQEMLDKKLVTGFCMRKNGCKNRLDTLVVLAEILPQQLPVRAVYSTREGLLFGPTRATESGYEPVADRLGNASLAKLLLLLPVAKAGTQTLCNRKVAGFRNVGGPAAVVACNPATGHGLVPVREALARSMNLPWIEAARLHLGEATRLQNSLGYPDPEKPDTPAALALGFGRYGSPAATMTLAAALVSGGRTEGLTLVKDMAARPLDLASLGYSVRNISVAQNLFRAPTEAGGTMRAAVSILNVPGCRITHAKSGTFFANGRTQAKYGLVVAECGPRRFVIYVGISGRKTTDNARGLRQADLVEFYRAALTAR